LLDRQLNYWQSQLTNLPVLNLPTDRPRLPVPSFEGATETFKLPKALTAALLELSRREDATLFMVLLAGFQLLLARYSGQTDIVIGSPIANRTRAEIEGLIGFFVNMLVLRTDLSALPTVRHLLSQVRDVCLSAYAHQDLPFEYLVEALQPERSLSYNPLFQVGFALQNVPQERLEMPELSLQPLVVAGSTSKFDLSLFMHEELDGVAGLLEYNTDLFDAATIRRLIEHFHIILSGMVADPDQPVFMLPLLAEPERQQLLVTWNETALQWGPWWSVT
jgi:non-ribosomal peptide synthetase component F